ncbi:hypothetical protein [Sunxiuqinia indica]|uniref:hypothetical protein n=1 Tax=Sunxiuqinia indica TaxID=2692584 RepID=UPI001358BD1C|nr:hypothetical protein [Sunxiuqinia indica]
MVDNICEHLRKLSVESCFELSAFRNGWSTWKIEIQNILGPSFDESDIINLGDHLSSIFGTTGKAGRSQSEVSGGGYGWEGLICWYLNLNMIGSRAVAVRKISALPSSLRDSISVNYGNFRSNTESDITVVIFPAVNEFTSDKNNLTITNRGGRSIPLTVRNKYNIKPILERLAEIHFDRFELGIIQCKTNWNDNAQIPMLWSMIYEANSFSNRAISVGRNGYSISDLRHFTYSFCTVPTNSLDNYTQNSTSVNRVRNLTGGNYWGNISSNGIASSVKEIFNNNFKSAFSPNQRTTLRNSLSEIASELSYFDIS